MLTAFQFTIFSFNGEFFEELPLQSFLHYILLLFLDLVVFNSLSLDFLLSGGELVFLPFLDHLVVFELNRSVLNLLVGDLDSDHTFKHDVKVLPLVAELYHILHRMDLFNHNKPGYLLNVLKTERGVILEKLLPQQQLSNLLQLAGGPIFLAFLQNFPEIVQLVAFGVMSVVFLDHSFKFRHYLASKFVGD